MNNSNRLSTPSLYLLLVFLSIIICSVESRIRCTSYLRLNDNTTLLDLPTNKELFDQTILPSNKYNQKQQLKSHLYQLKNSKTNQADYNHSLLYLLNTPLSPNSQYAIRISHSATSVADFNIRFHPNHKFVNFKLKSGKQSTGRDTLNTEIFKFRTNEYGYPDDLEDKQCIVIVIESFNTGVTPSLTHHDTNRLVSFNLILELETYGLPPEISRLVFVIVSSVIVVFLFLFKSLFPRMKGFQLLV